MTDRDPDSHSSRPTATDGTTLRDRWWWSPTLAIALGAVVVGYQVGALRSEDPIWLNWVVAALGVVAVLYGAVALLRAYRSR